MTRPLNEAERAVLTRIVSGQFPELLGQIDRARVTTPWSENALSVDIEVPDQTAIPGGVSGVVPVRAFVNGDNGELVGEVLVWASHGVLAALEYVTFTDEPPASLPSADRMWFE
ncbi:hypothetical protein [Kibdelosporangium aridum]|uniref:hypothetical protein n=1 Tax=Kibdelosporangium aridum TaxID=2030 RepID=UPI00052477D6